MIIVVQTLVYFRESIFDAIQNVFGYLYFTLKRKSDVSEDEEYEEVFSDYHDEKGVVFFPPVYVQRYAAVLECLTDKRWRGKLEKVVDLGYHDASFVNHLKDLPGIKTIMAVDIDELPLKCAVHCIDTNLKEPIKIELYQGNAADPDYRLIGCDAVVAIEMIEHMLPHDLERLVHTIFGFIKPQLVVITTPNGDFNVLFKALESNGLRRLDHFFEWSRSQFHDWCGNIVTRYPQYTVTCKGIGPGPQGTEHLGCCSQLAFFVSKDYHKQMDLDLNSLVQVFEVQNSDDNSSSDWKVTTTDFETAYSSIELSSSGTSSKTFETSYSSIDTVCRDRIIQCDIDNDYGKDNHSNDDLLLNTLKPRKLMQKTSYVIEDISCRLNCSMSHVGKFPKNTMELIEKNKDTPLFYIKDIISNLNKVVTKAGLNIQQEYEGEFMWNNINWGDQSPYWNQYYKVVKQLKYPNDEKTDLDIVDIILEEIDIKVKTNAAVNGLIVLPMSRVMDLVKNVSEDESYVRDYLQWNDFELIEDDLVYHQPAADIYGKTYLSNNKSDEIIIVPKTNAFQYIYFCYDKLESTNSTLNLCSSECNFLAKLVILWSLHDLFTGESIDMTDGLTTVYHSYSVAPKDEKEIDSEIQNKTRQLKFIMNIDDYIDKVHDITFRLALLALLRAEDSGVPKVLWFKWRLLNMLDFAERTVRRTRQDFLESYKIGSAKDTEKEAFDIPTKYKDDTKMDELLDKYDHLLHPKATNTNDFMEDFASSLSNEPSSTLIKQRSILTDSQSRQSLYEEECDSLGSGDPELLSQNFSESALKGAKYTLKEFHAIHFDKMEVNKGIDEEYSGDDQINCRSENGEMIYDMKYEDFESEPIIDNSNTTDSDSRLPTIESSEQGSVYAKPVVLSQIPNGIIELCKIRENNYNPQLADCDSDKPYKDTAEKTNKEHVQETMAFACPIIDINTNRCLSKSSKFCSENLAENVLFYDENEPSTSKGIRRHIRMDVQCGSDTKINASMLNVLPQHNSKEEQIHSSLTNLDPDALSNVPSTKINYFERAIVIKESNGSINIQDDYKNEKQPYKQNILATSISNSKDIYKRIPENNIVEEFIQDINLDKKLEINTETTLEDTFENTNVHDFEEHKIDSQSDKTLKMEFREEINDEKIVQPLSNLDINIINAREKPILSHGGTQMQSYSNKEVSEDIIFQGNWLSPIKEMPKTKTIIIKTKSNKKIHSKLSKENILKSLPRIDSSKRKNEKDKHSLNKDSLTSIQKPKNGFNYLQKPIDVHELTTVTQISIPIKNVKAIHQSKSPSKIAQKKISSDEKVEISRKSSSHRSNICTKENICNQEYMCSENNSYNSEGFRAYPTKIYRSSSDSSCSSSPDSIETIRCNGVSIHDVLRSSSSLTFHIKSFVNNDESTTPDTLTNLHNVQSANNEIIEDLIDLENEVDNNEDNKIDFIKHDSLKSDRTVYNDAISTTSEGNYIMSNENEEVTISNSVLEDTVLELNLDEIHTGESDCIPKALLTSPNEDLGQFSRMTSSPVPSEEQTITPRSVDLSTIGGSAPSETSEYMTVVDFETGSVDVIRKTAPDFNDSTSSVASYFSCNVDESAANGVFQNSNHEQEEEEEDVSRTLSNVFNENTEMSLEGLDASVVIEAGAGDGRGVHSDSQNSTGIDTSMNSDSNSDVSSGPITDAVTVHESSLSGDYDLLEENRSIIVLPEYVADAQYGEDTPEPRILIRQSRASEYPVPSATASQESDE